MKNEYKSAKIPHFEYFSKDAYPLRTTCIHLWLVLEIKIKKKKCDCGRSHRAANEAIVKKLADLI